jgi:hypothetical protein
LLYGWIHSIISWYNFFTVYPREVKQLDKRLLYKNAYRILEDSTPLRGDCGPLCGSACCKGDEDTGMYLFPCEEAVFQDKPEFLSVKPTNFIINDMDVLLAVCRGECPRNRRPLSCRIFPLVPYISSGSSLDIILDPRALQICPVAQNWNSRYYDAYFIKNVRKAFRLLIQDPDIRLFIERLSRILDDFPFVLKSGLGGSGVT